MRQRIPRKHKRMPDGVGCLATKASARAAIALSYQRADEKNQQSRGQPVMKDRSDVVPDGKVVYENLRQQPSF